MLAQLPRLRRLEVAPEDGDFACISQLTRLQHLSMLGAPLWKASCDEEEVWSLLCTSSLRMLQVMAVVGPAKGPGVCQVTDLKVLNMLSDVPLLPVLSKLEITETLSSLSSPRSLSWCCRDFTRWAVRSWGCGRASPVKGTVAGASPAKAGLHS